MAFGFPEGFTLVELLVTITIIAILASLLLTGISRAKSQVRRVQCINNQRQLIVAWSVYRDDNDDRLVGNGIGGPLYDPGRGKTWVWGGSHYEKDEFFNTDCLVKPEYALFASYIRAKETYRCPGDRTFLRLSGVAGTINPKVSRARSYSLNAFLASRPSGDTNLICFFKGSEFARVTPARIFAFQDLNPPVLCYPAAVTVFPTESFFHLPASHHSGAGVLTFGDGHAETHKWQDPRTARVFSMAELNAIYFGNSNDAHGTANPVGPKNPDLAWMRDHATIRDSD